MIGEGSMYWIEYKLFYFLVHTADPKLIGIKACWFGYGRTLRGQAVLLVLSREKERESI